MSAIPYIHDTKIPCHNNLPPTRNEENDDRLKLSNQYWSSQESKEMDQYIANNIPLLDYEVNIKVNRKQATLRNSRDLKKDRWKFNPIYLEEAVQAFKIGLGFDVTPNIDVFSLEGNKQCKLFISEHQDFLSNKYDAGAYGKSWDKFRIWSNAPWGEMLYKGVKAMERRGCKGLVLGPCSRNRYKKWYGKCEEFKRKGYKYYIFFAKNNSVYRDMFLPELTGYQKGLYPPPHDIIVWWLDFSHLRTVKFHQL